MKDEEHNLGAKSGLSSYSLKVSWLKDTHFSMFVRTGWLFIHLHVYKDRLVVYTSPSHIVLPALLRHRKKPGNVCLSLWVFFFFLSFLRIKVKAKVFIVKAQSHMAQCRDRSPSWTLLI